jgi:hypothetical protein
MRSKAQATIERTARQGADVNRKVDVSSDMSRAYLYVPTSTPKKPIVPRSRGYRESQDPSVTIFQSPTKRPLNLADL